MNTFIVDFDYTLYQTELFVRDLRAVFLGYGVDDAVYTASYQRALTWDGDGYGFDYSFEKHIQVLAEMGIVIDPARAVPQLRACIKKEYICSDAFVFLETLKRLGAVTLLTAGNVAFQRMKVETVGLPAYVDRCEYVQGNKETFVEGQLFHAEHVVFINDNSKENAILKKRFSDVAVLGKINVFKYDEKDARESGVPYFHTLTEIANYVVENYQ